MSYLYILFTLKVESVSKNTIFDLKMMMKSGRIESILKSLNAGNYFFLTTREDLKPKSQIQ